MRTEDGYIIRKCLEGEKEAFGFLVDKYKLSVYAFAYSKLHNFHDAEDITQEVFIKAFRKLHTLKWWDSFLSWLYAITSNLCKNFIRSKFNRPDREFIAEQDSAPFDSAAMNSYQEKQVHESLYEALASLPEIYQQVLTLHYLGGMTCKEIAQFFGTSPSAIKQRLSRGRLKLKKEMLDMMSETYEQQGLQPRFTFRIVEIVKRIKIKPAPSKPLLPVGLSAAATGIVLTVLAFNSYIISLTPLGSPMLSETKMMEVGELPVDVLEISEITFLSGEKGDDNGGAEELPNLQNAFAPPIAPSGKYGWTKRTDMQTLRGGIAVGVVNGKIYVIGGGVNAANPLSLVEEYDAVANTWTRKADMPTARGFHSASVVNGKIYVIGGGAKNLVLLPTVEEYNLATDTWTKKADIPTARGFHSTSVVNGKIYAIGGKKGPVDFVSLVEEYNPVTDTWTKKADMPTAREGLSTITINEKIYAIGGGGTGPKGKFFDILSVVEEYNPATDTWTKKADMPTARIGLSVTAVNGKIYAIGGGDTKTNKVLPTVEVYDTETDTWIKKEDMPLARTYVSTAAVNGRIYVIGGAKQFLFWGMQAVPLIPNVDVYDTGLRPAQNQLESNLLKNTRR